MEKRTSRVPGEIELYRFYLGSRKGGGITVVMTYGANFRTGAFLTSEPKFRVETENDRMTGYSESKE